MKWDNKIKHVVAYGVSYATLSIINMQNAFAASTPTASTSTTGPEAGFGMQQGLLFAAFILIFYFFIIRPQSKRAKEQRDLVGGLQKGDEVLTNAGIVGKITKVTDNFFVVMIAEGTEVLMQKQAIAGSLPKGTMKSV